MGTKLKISQIINYFEDKINNERVTYPSVEKAYLHDAILHLKVLSERETYMKKQFTFQEVVTYNHTIEVEIPDDKEDDFEDYTDQIAQKFYGSNDKLNLLTEFEEEYGSNNVTFIEDGSPEIEITCD